MKGPKQQPAITNPENNVATCETFSFTTITTYILEQQESFLGLDLFNLS